MAEEGEGSDETSPCQPSPGTLLRFVYYCGSSGCVNFLPTTVILSDGVIHNYLPTSKMTYDSLAHVDCTHEHALSNG